MPPHSAFTLIELLVAMVISAVLFTSLATFTHTSLQTTAVIQSQNVAEQTARTALGRIVREAALAGLVSAAEQYRLGFTCTDITGDGNDDTVEYSWSANTQILTRTLNGVSETFADHVSAFSFEYQYESENSVTIAAPGNLLPMPIGSYAGAYSGGSSVDDTIDVRYETWYVEQTFTNLVEVPMATSVTIRAKTNMLPPPVDTYVTLDNLSTTLAYGWLQRSQLATTFQDITIPLSWAAGAGKTMELGKTYRLRFRPGGSSPYVNYSATLLCRRITSGTGLGDGLTLAYYDLLGIYHSLGNRASLYFAVRGDLPVTTPRRSTVPTSVLKTIKAHIVVTDGDQTADLMRTCKVVNQ